MHIKSALVLTLTGIILFNIGLPQATASVLDAGALHRRHAIPQDDLAEYPSAQTEDDHARSGGGMVFEEVSLLQGSTLFTDRFEIFSEGTYEVTLTDFDFPKPLKMTGLNITTATESLGSLLDTGSFRFDADPGNYYLSFFAKADDLGQYGIRIAQYNGVFPQSGASPVPVPAAAWFLGSGLLALTGAVRRKR